MSIILLAATADAAQSDPIKTKGDSGAAGKHLHFTAPGLAGVEVATLQKQINDGTWVDYYIDAVIQQITATNTGLVVDGCGIWRINKGATVAAVGVEVSTPDSL